MKVRITPEMCRNHDYTDPRNCPLAAALKQMGYKDVRVGGTYISVGSNPAHRYSFQIGLWHIVVQAKVAKGEEDYILDIPNLRKPRKEKRG